MKKWLGKRDLAAVKAEMRLLSQTLKDQNNGVYTLQEMILAAEADEELMRGARPGYYTVNCFCSWIYVPQDLNERQMFYLACVQCKKRVKDSKTGYRCEKCNQTFSEAVPTYNFEAKMSDLSDTISLQCLGEIGEAIIGMPCSDFYNIAEDADQVKAQVRKMLFQKMRLVIRAKLDVFNEPAIFVGAALDRKPSIRFTVVRAIPHDIKSENAELLDRLSIYAKKK